MRNLDRFASVFHNMYENGNYDSAVNGERRVLDVLSHAMPVQTVFDVGANCGAYAQAVVDAIPEATVFAFEPIPSVFAELQNLFQSVGSVQPRNVALSDSIGELELCFDPNNTGVTTALTEQSKLIHPGGTPEFVKVAALTGDTFCQEHCIDRIDLLKIDVEGYERSVLSGFDMMIQAGRKAVIQIEYGQANLVHKYFLRDYFTDYGQQYVIGKIFPRGVEFYEDYALALKNFIGPNYLLVRRDLSSVISALAAH